MLRIVWVFFVQSLSSIDFQVAMMLIIIVVVFVVCHSIRSIVNSYEFIQYIIYGSLKDWPDWIATLVHFRLVPLLCQIRFVIFSTLHIGYISAADQSTSFFLYQKD